MKRLHLVLIPLLLASACSQRDGAIPAGDPAALAGEALRAQGRAERLVAEMTAVVPKPEGGTVSLSLWAWCDADGKARMRATKVDVDILDGLLRADGSFTFLNLEAREVCEGRLADLATGHGLLSRLGLLVDEVRQGPAPRAEGWAFADLPDAPAGARWLRAPLGDGICELLIAGDRRSVLAKRLLAADGREQIHLAYSRHDTLDGLFRPTRAVVRLPGDQAPVRVYLRSLDDVPGLRPGTFDLALPADWKRVEAKQLLERLESP